MWLIPIAFLGVFLLGKKLETKNFNFDYCFKIVVGEEGGFQKRASDRGNWTGGKVGVGVLKGTKFGVSAAAYPHLNIEDLTLEQAKEIYYRDYWLKLKLHEPTLNLTAFDCAINQGVSFANELLTKCRTLPTVLAMANFFKTERLARYVKTASISSDYAEYLTGWKNRLNRISDLTTA